MAKVKKSPTSVIHKEPVEKMTRQGNGRRSKASHGRKLRRGQGK
jgi:hypothetical protein